MSDIFLSVNINGIDMLNRYRMALKDRHCVQPPVPKTYYQDVPGADGSLDFSTVNAGRITYERRTVTLNFGCGYPINDWPVIFSDILQKFHGQIGKLIFDDDPMYYYIGRMEVSDYNRVQSLGTFTITVQADPYKYEITAGDEEWLWDALDFEKGVIREYGNLAVSGEYRLIVDGTKKWIIPEIVVSKDMSVTFGGKEYALTTGNNKIYDIVLKEGENLLVFKGTGTVTVRYRGAVL